MILGPRSGIFCPPKYEIWFEMGFNGSIGVHIKTGRRHMAEDHFRTLLDPPKGYERSKNPKEPKKLLELSRLQYLQDYEAG